MQTEQDGPQFRSGPIVLHANEPVSLEEPLLVEEARQPASKLIIDLHPERDVVINDLVDNPNSESFSEFVESYRMLYKSKTRLEQPIVAVQVLTDWKGKQRGRFVRRTTDNEYEVVSDKRARAFITKTLRNAMAVPKPQPLENQPNHLLPNSVGPLQSHPPRSLTTSLHSSGTLYGRNVELQRLRHIFETVASNKHSGVNHCVLLSGESGAGKTALAHSLQDIVSQQGGLFISGKFQGLIHTNAVQVALEDLVNQLPSTSIQPDTLMESVLETLDVAEVSILTQLLPGLERYFGGVRESSDATTQINAQALTRQTFVVGVLLECVSKLSGPIVFCMDDLQWASKSSIDSLTAWMSNSKLQRVLFVGTHRPLSQASLVEDSFTRRLLPSDVSICRIELAPLQMEDVQSMLAGSLGLRDIQQVKSLSRMVHESTSGNVGFLCELLRHFRDQELLCWDGTQWKCDDHMINITWRSIVDLYGSRLVDLDPDTLKTLQVAGTFHSFLSLSL